MPTKIGVVFIGVNLGGDPGSSRPCYAAWWPGDCSGFGREGTGWRPALFCGLEGQWGIVLPPLSPCYGRSGSGRRKHTRGVPRVRDDLPALPGVGPVRRVSAQDGAKPGGDVPPGAGLLSLPLVWHG